MEFSQFETKSGAEVGAFLHFTHLRTGELLYDKEAEDEDKRVGVWLRGMEAKSVQAAAREAQRTAIKSPLNEDDDSQGLETAKAMVIRFQNITRDGKPLSVSEEDLVWFFNLSSVMVQRVVGFASQPANFLTAA